ncbi:MAG: carboxypeptidase-like regulatory domain-containing protein [Planctomycetota bacterium]
METARSNRKQTLFGLMLLFVAMVTVWVALEAGSRAERESAPMFEASDAREFQTGSVSATQTPDRDGEIGLRTTGGAEATARRESVGGASPQACRVLGRCVDADGQPIAGVRLRIRGSYGTHREVSILGEERSVAATNQEGRFEVRFSPDRLSVHDLTLTHPDFVDLTDYFVRVEPGATHDCGTVPLVEGFPFAARLVDSQGRPTRPLEQPATLTLEREVVGRRNLGFRPEDEIRLFVDRSGHVRSTRLVAGGIYSLETSGFDLVNTREFLEFDGRDTMLEVPILGTDDYQHIRGFVIDERRQGLGDAIVYLQPRDSFRTRVRTTTDENGAFDLRARPYQDVTRSSQMQLRVTRFGYESVQTEAVFDWGDRDAQVVLHRNPTARFLLRSAADGEPVTRARLRSFPNPTGRGGIGRVHLVNDVVLSEGQSRFAEFPDGVVERPLIGAGEHLIWVVPDPVTGLAADWFEVDVPSGRSSDFTLELDELVEQVVEVRATEGHSLARAAVEVIDPNGESVDVNTPTISEATPHQTGTRARRLFRSLTESGGRTTVRGPRNRVVAIRAGLPWRHGRAEGSGSGVTVIHGVRLGGDPIQITIP